MENKYDRLGKQETQDLFKAMTTGNFAQVNGPAAQVGGSALIPESLEATLKNVTYTENNLKLWKQIPKQKANSTVEEYNRLSSYGEGLTAFAREMNPGRDTSSNLSRQYAKVKCLNTQRSVSHLMTLVNQVTDAEALEVRSGIQFILRQAEEHLFYGDSSLAANEEEGIEWDGLLKQIAPENHIDLKGTELTDKVLNQSSEMILNNYGVPSKAYMPIAASALFSENYYPDQRALMNVAPGTVTAGTTVTQFNSIGGTIDIEPDVFMRKGITPLDPNRQALGSQPPSAPILTATADATTPGDFKEGTYKYAVIAVSEMGESVPVELKTPVAVTGEAQKQSVKLTIKNADNQVYAPEYFVVFRTAEDGKYYEIGRVGAKTSNKSGETEFIDSNQRIPGTASVVIGDFRSEETVAFKQLTDIFKLDYAITAPVKRFGIFLYGTPIVYAPKKFVVLNNVKVKRS